MFNQRYNFRYNASGTNKRAVSKTGNNTSQVAYKISQRISVKSRLQVADSIARGILKLAPRHAESDTPNVKTTIDHAVSVAFYPKPDIHVFNRFDERLAILSNEGDRACPFWDGFFREVLNGGESFEFKAPATHEDSQYLVAENKVAFKDKDDKFRLFVIRGVEKSDSRDGPILEVDCESEWMGDFNDTVIEDKRPQNASARQALDIALEKTRYESGEVASLGNYNTNFYFISTMKALKKIVEVWGGEIRARIEVDEKGISGRYIDLLTRRGAETGKRWEIDKDIISISHTVESYPKTALYGRGASLETEGGGFTRKITFEDVEWSVSNGDPVDKPLGQKWIGDPDALDQFGDPLPDGSLKHRYGTFEDGNIEDPEELLWATWNQLQSEKEQFNSFELDVALYAEKAGLEHESVRLGDTTIAIDRRFANPIEAEERVIAFEYDIANPDDRGTVEFGQFRDLLADDERMDKIQDQLDSTQGTAKNPEVDDNNFPDNKPEIPTKFEADGLFKIIKLSWDYNASAYIAAYEVYASQTKGFNPTADRLVWRGKSGGFNFDADTDEQWYFRLRAVNTHGTASDFTGEVQANTVKIDAGYDVLPLTITNELIAENARIDFAKIANVEITNAMITNIIGDKVTAGEIKSRDGRVVFNLDDSMLHLSGSGTQSMRFDDTGITTRDNDGNIRIHMGIRSIGGKGESDPSTIRFFSGSGSTSASIGMNVEDHFIIGSSSSNVAVEIYSGRNTNLYFQQLRLSPKDAEHYWIIRDRESDTGYSNQAIEPNRTNWGYLGSSDYRINSVYTTNLHYYEQFQLSSKEYKENIRDLPLDYLKSLFDEIEIKAFNYKVDGMQATKRVPNFGIIAEDTPKILLSNDEKAVNITNFLYMLAGNLKHLEQRVIQLEG